jgi:hypothetical protein
MQHLVAEHCSRKYDGRQEVNSTLLVSGGLFSMRLINGRLKGRGILQCLLLNDETEASIGGKKLARTAASASSDHNQRLCCLEVRQSGCEHLVS